MKKYSILIVGIGCYFGHLKDFIINLKKKNPFGFKQKSTIANAKKNKDAIVLKIIVLNE